MRTGKLIQLGQATIQGLSGFLFGTAGVVSAITPDGWIPATGSWSYASASTINVPTGAASIYQKGDKLKLTQPTLGVKYFYIITVADTLLTVTGGTNYSLASEAITLPFYSHEENPISFPGYFFFVPTCSGAGGSVGSYAQGVYSGMFSISHNFCTVIFKVKVTNVGSWSGDVFCSLPPIPSSTVNENAFVNAWVVANNANPATGARAMGMLKTSTQIGFQSQMDAANLAWITMAANDEVFGNFSYPI